MPIGSTQHANAFLDAVIGNTAAYANFKIALLTALPTGAVSTAVEVTGGAYDRVSIANNGTTWGAPSAARAARTPRRR